METKELKIKLEKWKKDLKCSEGEYRGLCLKQIKYYEEDLKELQRGKK